MNTINNNNPIALWHVGFYDGPHNGVCQYNNEIVWFDMGDDDYKYSYMTPAEIAANDDDDDDDHIKCIDRLYQLYKLTNEEIKDLFISHHMFMEMVGTHCSYFYEPIYRGLKKDESKKNEFYALQKNKLFTLKNIDKSLLITPIKFRWEDFRQVNIKELAINTILLLNSQYDCLNKK